MITFADTSFDSSTAVVFVNISVIVISLVFIIFSTRSIVNALTLAYYVKKIFKSMKGDFPWKELVPLFDIWHYIVTTFSILAIIGTVMKLLLAYDVS